MISIRLNEKIESQLKEVSTI